MINFKDPQIQTNDLLGNPQKYVTPRRSTTDKTKGHPLAIIGFVFHFLGSRDCCRIIHLFFVKMATFDRIKWGRPCLEQKLCATVVTATLIDISAQGQLPSLCPPKWETALYRSGTGQSRMFSLGAGQAWARYKGPYVLCWHGCPPRPILPVTDTAPSNSTPCAVWPPRLLHGEEP